MTLQITLTDLWQINQQGIKRAGPRYTPGITEGAPNLQIRSLVEAIDALAYSSGLQRYLSKLEGELSKAWNQASRRLREIIGGVAGSTNLCSTLLTELRLSKPADNSLAAASLAPRRREILEKVGSLQRSAREELAKLKGDSEATPRLQGDIEDLRKMREALDDLAEWLSSPAYLLLSNNRLFIRGEWGTGKTHFLCDTTVRRMDINQPTLFLLASSLPHGMSPLEAICRVGGFSTSPEELLCNLNQLGIRSGGRALLIIDGINEGDRPAWRKHIDDLADQIKKYPYVGLVVSCRTPFEETILSPRSEAAFVKVAHLGFEEKEFDAQREFFRFYEIPEPQIPLLTPEFSRPLFLKILCTSVSALTRPSAKRRRINDFASGHKGMTRLLEDFVTVVGRQIEIAHQLPSKTCWFILKGKGDRAQICGIAPRMAELGQDYLSEREAVSIVAKIVEKNGVDPTVIFRELITDGLLTEDAFFEAGVWSTIIRLPYQRFSDHLISRHMLACYLDTTSPATIRKSLLPGKPIGRIFKIDRRGRNYLSPGLASALMLEFPERVKRVVHPNKKELFYYLPLKSRTSAVQEPFIQGLLWRDESSFNRQTDTLVGHFLNDTRRHVQEETLEALVCLALRDTHPYRADRLFQYLERLSMPDRDLFWTDFLRTRTESSVVYRLMDWVLQGLPSDITESAVDNIIVLSSLFLTSTVRPLRDRATHCMVALGDRFPSLLFRHALRALNFNDIYVGERMIAAAYGTLMRVWAVPPVGFEGAAVALATELRRRLTGSDVSAPIEHVLLRDFATGFIELLSRSNLSVVAFDVTSSDRVSKNSIIPSASTIKESSVDAAKAAIRMDFNNYTIGRLVKGRQNYDENHKEYRRVRKQIYWRILDLGYSENRFREVDRQIANDGFSAGRGPDAGKTDRYGKKYSWIAFYEVAGRREINGLRHRDEARLSEIDIDPSFPERPRKWKPSTSELYAGGFTSVSNWMGGGLTPDYSQLLTLREIDGSLGPWVLLNGFIMEAAENDGRRAFTFLRSLLVQPQDVSLFEAKARSIAYPGNSSVPEAGEDHYVFAGEIGASPKYGSRLRVQGKAEPQIGEAFSETETETLEIAYKETSRADRTRLIRRLIISPDEEVIREALDPEEDDLVQIYKYHEIPGVQVEVPVWRYSWESYHSVENDGRNPEYPAPALVEGLGLRKAGGAVDLVDLEGKPATKYREFKIGDAGMGCHLLYIRLDLINTYLRLRKRDLVCFNWGEREMDHETIEKVRDDPAIRAIWDSHDHIHKQLFVYNPRDPSWKKLI